MGGLPNQTYSALCLTADVARRHQAAAFGRGLKAHYCKCSTCERLSPAMTARTTAQACASFAEPAPTAFAAKGLQQRLLQKEATTRRAASAGCKAEVQLRTQCIDSDAGCKVQVLLAGGVKHASALAAREHQVWPHISLHDVPTGKASCEQHITFYFTWHKSQTATY